jgi:hypothetical protein
VDNCGIDVALKSSSVCILDVRGEVLLEQAVSTDEAGFESVLKGLRRMRCVAGGRSFGGVAVEDLGAAGARGCGDRCA